MQEGRRVTFCVVLSHWAAVSSPKLPAYPFCESPMYRSTFCTRKKQKPSNSALKGKIRIGVMIVLVVCMVSFLGPFSTLGGPVVVNRIPIVCGHTIPTTTQVPSRPELLCYVITTTDEILCGRCYD